MVLDKLGSTLRKGVTRIGNAIFLDKKLLDSIVKDIQKALIEADVDIELIFELTQKIKKLGLDENIKGIDKKEQLVTLIHDEIMNILGGEAKELQLKKKTKIMFIGLYGAGKTTNIAKIGFYYAKRGRKVCAIGLDTDRPAAMDQLEQMCEKAKIPCFVDKKEKDPLKIYESYKKDLDKYDLVLVDTAGRDGLNKELIAQIEKIDKKVKADLRLLVLPADVGQTAKTQATEFQKALSIDGVIITRMDGTSKGGGALTACAESKAPVYFIGVGEQIHEIETFNPRNFVNRLLGMGDLASLLEKVKSATDEKQAKRIEERLKEGKFTLRDLAGQLEQMNQLGSMDKLLSMVPGMGGAAAKIPKSELEKQEKKMSQWKSAISSMTEYEIENPESLEKQTSRIARIAKGSGTTTTEIRALLKQYKLLKEMMNMQNPEKLASGQIDKKMMQKIAKQMKGKVKF
ncbi:signal recognition particle protein [Candidatus Pacearchaeota archaeon]|nr:signal recognition particle protein [Candidatus Pacearchaeota archaeon]|tara:strand:- start:5561 stop:6934 length:1374 start_codon:yes stop_codon:yes gene_type:complete